jgi:hypothetical protein
MKNLSIDPQILFIQYHNQKMICDKLSETAYLSQTNKREYKDSVYLLYQIKLMIIEITGLSFEQFLKNFN